MAEQRLQTSSRVCGECHCSFCVCVCVCRFEYQYLRVPAAVSVALSYSLSLVPCTPFCTNRSILFRAMHQTMQTAICKRQKCNLYGMLYTYVAAPPSPQSPLLSLSLLFTLWICLVSSFLPLSLAVSRISADHAAAATARVAAVHIRGIFHMTVKGAFPRFSPLFPSFLALFPASPLAALAAFMAHFNCNSNISDNYSMNTTGISKERNGLSKRKR